VDRRTLDAVRMISFVFHQYTVELFHLPQYLKKRRAALRSSSFLRIKNFTPQEKACLAVHCVCIAIIIDMELCITRLEALIFISLHPLNWADYTINNYKEKISERIRFNPLPIAESGFFGPSRDRDWQHGTNH